MNNSNSRTNSTLYYHIFWFLKASVAGLKIEFYEGHIRKQRFQIVHALKHAHKLQKGRKIAVKLDSLYKENFKRRKTFFCYSRAAFAMWTFYLSLHAFNVQKMLTG